LKCFDAEKVMANVKNDSENSKGAPNPGTPKTISELREPLAEVMIPTHPLSPGMHRTEGQTTHE
jgi:hypothetical protein